MAKLTLTDIAGGYGLVTAVNANWLAIETAMENTLSRDGTSPNSMSANLDMNSNRVINVTDPSGNQDAATKSYVDTSITSLTAGSIDFSTGANYTITGAWTFSGNQNFSGNLVVTDGSTNDHTIYESGGALYIENDVGTSQFVQFNDYGSAVFNDGMLLRLNSPDNTESSILRHTGDASEWKNFQGTEHCTIDFPYVQFTGDVYVENGSDLRVYDSSDTDYGYFVHTGTQFEIRTTGTTNGQVPLHLNPGGVQPVVVETGALMISEASGAVADVAGNGQFWVKDDTPNIPKFTDDAGTDFSVGIMETGTFTGTLTGCTTSPTATFQYIKEKLPNGYIRATIWPEAGLTATSNTTACSITGVPAALSPPALSGRDVSECRDNGNGVDCLALLPALGTQISLSIQSSGTWSSVGFTNTGVKGINAGTTFTFIYN